MFGKSKQHWVSVPVPVRVAGVDRQWDKAGGGCIA